MQNRDKDRGEPVFNNVEEILAEKIVERSKENSNLSPEPIPEEKENSADKFTSNKSKSPSSIHFWIIALGIAAFFFILLKFRKRT